MKPDTSQAAFDRLHEAQDRREKARETGDIDAQIVSARDCGLGHFEVGQLRLARALFMEARRIIEESGKRKELLPELIGMTGRTLQRMKQWEPAFEQYRLAARAAEAQNLPAGQLKWRGKEVRTRLDLGEPANGLSLLEDTVTYGRTLLDEGGEAVTGELAQLTSLLANSLQEQDAKRAETLWEETFSLLDSIEPSRHHFLAAVNYAGFLSGKRKFYLARTYLEEALELGRRLRLPEPQLLAVAVRVADLLRNMRDAERGGDYLMDQLVSITDPVPRSEVLTAAIDCYFDGSAWAKMKQCCGLLAELRSASMELPAGISHAELQQMGATDAGRFDLEMRYSIACRGLGEIEEGLSALRKALQHAEAWGNPDAVMKARGQTAIMLVEHGDYAEAARLGMNLWDEGGRTPLLARTLVDAFIGTGELNRAEEIRDTFAEGGGAPLDVALMTAHLAEAGRGDPVEAWYAVGAAADRDRSVEAEALSSLLEHYPRGSKDRFEAARARLRLLDSARTQVTDVFSEASWRSFTPLSNDFPTYLDSFLDTALDAERDEEAIYELERFRSQMLLNVLSERSALWTKPHGTEGSPVPQEPQSDSGEGPDIVSFARGDSLTARFGGRDHDARGGYENLRFKSKTVDDHLRARYRFDGLVATNASWRARREAAAEVDRLDELAFSAGGVMHVAPGFQGLHFPANLQEHLRDAGLADEEFFVFQHVMPDRTVFWAMDANGRIFREAIPGFTRGELIHLLGSLWRTVPDALYRQGQQHADTPVAMHATQRHLRPLPESEASSLDAVLSRLDKRLVKPLTAWLKGLNAKRVFLVAGTDVTNLPLDSCERLLGSGIEVCFLPTGRALGFVRAPRRPLSGWLYLPTEEDRDRWAAENMAAVRSHVLLVLDPTRSLRFAPLEAAMIAHRARDWNVQTLGPNIVNKEDLRQASGRVELLHLIGHGAFDDRSPYRSGMHIDDRQQADALWTIAEIFSEVEAPAGRLAVLSGCETGRTRPNLVSEEVSLPAALLAAGFAAVIGSRWPVDDLSTTLLMSELYYRWMGGGIGIGKALQESAGWLRTLDREMASATVRDLPEQLKQTLPAQTVKWSQICRTAAQSIATGPEHPFGDPSYWAAFFVAGDGSITSDGSDPRVPPP